MRFKYLFIIIGIGIVVGVVQYCSPVPPPPPVADNGPWIMPGDVKNTTKATQVDYNDFAYQSFIALNWPAKQGEGSNRGEPDTTKKLGAQGPVVWMTYKRPSEVFLENAKTPNGWNAPPPPPPSNCPPEAAKATIFYRAAKASDNTIDELTQAGFPGGDELVGALVDQNQEYVWYELAFNQSWFEYILKYQFYNAKEQEKYTTKGEGKIPDLPKTGKESDLPKLPFYAQQGVVEIKASWRILKDNDIKERYYRTQGYIVDPQGNCDPKPKDMGLVGLHILRLTTTTPNTWFWATFEQVDNVEIKGTPPTQSNGQSLTPSFNPGPDGTKPPPYLGGYIINGKMTELPKPLPADEPLPPINERPKVNVSRLHNIPENATTADAKYRDKLKDTVWQYYHLVGTQTPITSDVSSKCWVAGHHTEEDENMVDKPGYKINACNLANTTMETYVQGTSCVECHAYAAPIGDQGAKYPTNQIFTFMLLNAKRP